MADAGPVAAMGETVRAAIPTLMVVGGLALVAYAAYLHYVALPAEQSRQHMIIRGTLLATGVLLLLLGVASMH